MKKIRYINHETLYLTSERVDHLKVERYLMIKCNIENFVPILTHPIVKNAREIDVYLDYIKPNFIFHCNNLLIHGAKYFSSIETLNIRFNYFVDGCYHP